MRIFLGIFDTVFITRPMLWIPVWGFALIGYWLGLQALGAHPAYFSFSAAHVHAYLLIFLFSCSVGCVYVLNQAADKKADAANAGFALLAHGRISPVAVITAIIITTGISLVLPVFSGSRLISSFSAVALLLGTAYSFPPCSFSGKPVADFLANAIGFGIVAFGTGWLCSGAPLADTRMVSAAMPWFLMMCAGSISSTLPDVSGDSASGKKTTAVVFGAAKAHLLATAFIALAIIDAFRVKDTGAFCCALFSFPWYSAYVFVKKQWLMEAVYKIGGAAVMVYAAILFPLFGVAAFLILGVTKLYFRIRFKVRYPSMLPAAQQE
jgi:4-hydroxybenzoate polyprenyltransferase